MQVSLLTQAHAFLKSILIAIQLVNLQCCISFLCTAKWLSFIHAYVYIYICILFTIMVGCSCMHVFAQLCSTLCDPLDCSLPGSSIHGIFPGKNTGVGCYFFLQEIFLIQGLNLHFLQWQVLYHWVIWEALWLVTENWILVPSAIQYDFVVYPSY